jgi:fucose permease
MTSKAPLVGLGPTRTVVIVAASLVGASLPVFLLSALAPAIQADLGFGEAALGLAVAAFFLAAAGSSVPGGRFADRYGAPTALRTGLIIAASGGAGVALLAASRWSLAAAMFLGGTALGFVDTGGARAIAAAVPSTRQGMAFGAKEASIPVASFLAGASVPLLGAQFGWRAGFGVGVGVALAVAASVSGRLEAPGALGQVARSDGDEPPGTGSPRGAEPERRISEEAAPRSRAATAHQGPTAAADQPMGNIWPLLLLSLTAALGGGAAAATTAFLVASSVSGGLQPGAAGTLLAGASAVAIAARLGVGAAADRRAAAAVPIVATMLVLGSLGAAGLTIGSTTDRLTGTAIAAVLIASAVLAIGAGWGWTGLVFLAAVRLDQQRPAKAAGIVLAGLGLGGAVAPALFGAIAGRAGYGPAWTVTTAAMLTAALTAIVAHRLARSTS